MANDEIQWVCNNLLLSTKPYTSLSLFRSGPVTHRGTPCYSAKFELGCDISSLFPYLNAKVGGAQFYTSPEYIKFMHGEHLCILYPKEGAFTPVDDHADAVDFLRLFLEFISNIALRSNGIHPDFRQYSSISPIDIFKLLPGTNCQECGFFTCIAFAAALSRQKTSKIKCPYLPMPVEEKTIFNVVDKYGKSVQTVSLPINTSRLYEEIDKKDLHIQMLQDRLAEFEISRAGIEVNNAKLISPLTKREIEVLEMVAHGATNKEISKKMNISEHTVKSHVIHIYDKLGVNDRAQASVWAAKNGLL